ncbi:MAG: phage tail fiber protein [Dermatophilaceae bacterium]
MGLGVTGANAALNGLVSAGLWVSIHSADPGTTGANEATGGGYARLSVGTWPAAASSSLTWTGNLVFSLPVGTWTYFGVWSASTAGSFVVSGPLGSAITTKTPNTITLSAITIPAVGQ